MEVEERFVEDLSLFLVAKNASDLKSLDGFPDS